MTDLLSTFKDRGALLEGHFLLSSGLHSALYLQCALVLMDPELASRLGRKLAKALQPLLGAEHPGAVVAPALGGVLVAHEVARALGCRGLFTERQDGATALRRGFSLEPGEPVVVVEDVITTGGSTREVIDAVRGRGARVLAVGSLVDRSSGLDLGVPRCSLLQLDAPTYAAESCPLCRQGSKPEKPGSRARPAREAP
jgi:orotate phosphoribosyltransferase